MKDQIYLSFLGFPNPFLAIDLQRIEKIVGIGKSPCYSVFIFLFFKNFSIEVQYLGKIIVILKAFSKNTIEILKVSCKTNHWLLGIGLKPGIELV